MYTMEEEAIRLVVKAFENQKRLKEDINLSFHSISVGFMLKDIGCSNDVVVSGLLHDIIEDTSFDYNYIESNFGKVIADNVLAVSEDKTIEDWKDRKVKFMDNLNKQSADVIMIELADKLHNLISDYDLWKIKGEEALSTLKSTYSDNKWYYKEMGKIFNENLTDNKLLDRYNEIIEIYFSR